MDANKEKALEAALGQIERQFGKGTVMRMGDREQVAIPAISTIPPRQLSQGYQPTQTVNPRLPTH